MLITLAAPTSEPVTVEEAKADLRMTHSADDDLIERQIASARSLVEQWTGIALADAQYRQTYGDATDGVRLPLLPATVDGVTEIVDDVRVELEDYTEDAQVGWIGFTSGASVVVDFTAVPEFIPDGLKTAILLLVRAEYEATPDDAAKLRQAARDVAYPYRRTLGV